MADLAEALTNANRVIEQQAQEIERLRTLLCKVNDSAEAAGRTVYEVPHAVIFEVYEAVKDRQR